METAKWTTANSTLDDQEGINEFRLDPPASMDRIKKLCGLNNVELYLAFMATNVDNATKDHLAKV